MDFAICLYNLGDRESEKPKRPMCTSWLLNNYVQSRVNFENFVFSGMAKVRSQHVHMDVLHFLCISMIYQYLGRKLACLCWLLNIIFVKVVLPAKNQFLVKIP